jgi:chemosensory pili system protein ChpA (sensor histidine kinase/response regulator)
MQAVDVLNTPTTDVIDKDLGPLSWVVDELGRSFDASIKILKRFLGESNHVQSELSAVDVSQLRTAKHHFHQASGVLRLLDMHQVAGIVDAMVTVTGSFVQKPSSVTQDAVSKLENTCFAMIEYLGSLLAEKNVSLLSLFVQYRNINNLVGTNSVHPADLWVRKSFQWLNPTIPTAGSISFSYSPALRHDLDDALLRVIKSQDEHAAGELSQLCLGLAQSKSNEKANTFWKICAAFFEAISQKLIVVDVYVKRAAAGIIVHYNNLQHGDWVFSDIFMQNMLFFCGQARIKDNQNCPILHVVQQAWKIDSEDIVNYEVSQFGRFDPAVLALSKKRIVVAKDLWTSLTGGDVQKIRSTSEQFRLLAESLIKLFPSNQALATALINASDMIVATKQVPSAELSMEVATAILYIEAVFEGWGSKDEEMKLRAAKLAQRIESVRNGGQAITVEPWIEELYRRVSDKESMGSVVGELRICLSDIEKSIDQYFRSPNTPQILQSVPEKLRQMRGIFSVLGLSEASSAVIDMRERVQEFEAVNYDFESARALGVFDKFGNNLGALGFLIDMLSYQPALAKKLFVFDTKAGTLNPLMGRVKQSISNKASTHDAAPDVESMSSNNLRKLSSQELNLVDSASFQREATKIKLNEESDLKDVFLEEASGVVNIGIDATRSLLQNPRNLEAQSTLRRAFHTLKGSSRMVGFNDFGEAAWAFEQLMNTRLADQQPFDSGICQLSMAGLHTFKSWLQDLGANAPTLYDAQQFRLSADAMRFENRLDLRGLVETANSLVNMELQSDTTVQNEIQVQVAQQAFNDVDTLNLSSIQTSSGLVKEVKSLVSVESVLAQDNFIKQKPIDLIEPPIINSVEETVTKLAPKIEEKQTVHNLNTVVIPLATVTPIRINQNQNQNEEQVKNIGPLKINIPLYNVYLNEADEWSRCLVTELDEWVIEHHKPLSISTVNFAHSLAGSSATVGFSQLANLSKSLEHALDKVIRQKNGTKADALIFAQVAEECRRLLHQFAAGFLEEPKSSVVARLDELRIAKESLASQRVVENRDITAEKKLPKITQSVVAVSMLGDLKVVHQPKVINYETINFTDEDIELVDSLDIDLFHIFDEEARELLPQLGNSLRKWVSNPKDLIARSEVLRTLHTLKGSARLAGAMRLGELSHRMESEIESIGFDDLNAEVLDPLLVRLDVLQNHFESMSKSLDDVQKVEDSSAMYGSLSLNVSDENSKPEGRVSPQELPETLNVKAAVKPPAVSDLKSEKRESRQSVRVRARLLDRLVNQAGEVILTRTKIESELGQLRGSLGDLSGNLDRLRQQLRDVEFQAETQMQSRMEQAKGAEKSFDPLEFDRFTRVQELTRMMAESVNDVATVQRNLQKAVDLTEDDLVAQARLTRDLQRDLLRTRMEEFESISDRLYRVVRQAAKDSEKQVRLDIVGGSIELDRGVLERMTASFEHLLRNCIAHGIESADKRKAAGKDPIGHIAITLLQDGNDVVIEFGDDGAGLNHERIRNQAVAQELIQSSDILNNAEIVNLIFTPGMSTASRVTELAGRGIGLDVVRTEVQALGGRIDVSSEADKGTKFKLVLPLTTAVTQVVMLRAGSLAFGVPSHLVEIVRRSPLAEVVQAYEHGCWGIAQDNVPFYWAGALLQTSQRSSEPLTKTNPVVIFKSAGQRIAIHIDEIFGNKEVVIKNLGPQLSKLPGLAGMAILASGAVALIYNPVALASVYGASVKQYIPVSADQSDESYARAVASRLSSTKHQTPLILVVDDSITVRRVTQRMLQREGFRVVLAVDGLQAIEKLNQEIPAVVLSDIEMPRMDGFDLVRHIRADSKLKHLPVVMITSRIAEKHRELAMALGVNDYLGKPYSEEGLLAVLRQHTAKKINESEKV